MDSSKSVQLIDWYFSGKILVETAAIEWMNRKGLMSIKVKRTQRESGSTSVKCCGKTFVFRGSWREKMLCPCMIVVNRSRGYAQSRLMMHKVARGDCASLPARHTHCLSRCGSHVGCMWCLCLRELLLAQLISVTTSAMFVVKVLLHTPVDLAVSADGVTCLEYSINQSVKRWWRALT